MKSLLLLMVLVVMVVVAAAAAAAATAVLVALPVVPEPEGERALLSAARLLRHCPIAWVCQTTTWTPESSK